MASAKDKCGAFLWSNQDLVPHFTFPTAFFSYCLTSKTHRRDPHPFRSARHTRPTRTCRTRRSGCPWEPRVLSPPSQSKQVPSNGQSMDLWRVAVVTFFPPHPLPTRCFLSVRHLFRCLTDHMMPLPKYRTPGFQGKIQGPRGILNLVGISATQRQHFFP